MGRLGLLDNILTKFGFIPELTGFHYVSYELCGAFKHANTTVRDMARHITVHCYQHFGDEVENYIKDLRPKQLEEYRAAFSEASGIRSPQQRQQQKTKNAGGGRKAKAGRSAAKSKEANNAAGVKNRGGGNGGGGGGGGGRAGASENPRNINVNGKKVAIDGDSRDININISVTQEADGSEGLQCSERA